MADAAGVAGAGAVAREAGPRLRADAVVLARVGEAAVAHETRANSHRARVGRRIDHVAADDDVAHAAHERRVARPVAAQIIRLRRLDVERLHMAQHGTAGIRTSTAHNILVPNSTSTSTSTNSTVQNNALTWVVTRTFESIVTFAMFFERRM